MAISGYPETGHQKVSLSIKYPTSLDCLEWTLLNDCKFGSSGLYSDPFNGCCICLIVVEIFQLVTYII